jgi:hypothetical protein
MAANRCPLGTKRKQVGLPQELGERTPIARAQRLPRYSLCCGWWLRPECTGLRLEAGDRGTAVPQCCGAAVFAALGRVEEAKAAVADTLRRFPDLTIQTYVGTPDWSDAERQRLVETMRKAGFPACAKPEAVAKTINVSLPECPQPTAANEHPIPPWSAMDLERYGATNRP